MCDSLKEDYDVLHTNIPLFSSKNRPIAEIDIIAKKGNKYDIYEVKCSHRPTKAKKQLSKIKKVLSKTVKVRNAFFFCGESGKLLEMMI